MISKIKNMVRAEFHKITELDYHTWVFSSVDNCNFNYNSRYLFLYVKEYMKDIKPLFVINDHNKREKLGNQYGTEYFVDSNSVEGIEQVLKSGVWFTSAGLPVYEWRGNPNRIVVNLWHGIPLKKVALGEEKQSVFTKLYFRRMFSGKYTYILTTSRKLIAVMAESFAVPLDKVKIWGQPRNDLLWEENRAERVKKALGITGADKLILYAPTYREYGQIKLFPFQEYSCEELEEFLAKRNWHICIRTHLEEQNKQSQYESQHVHFLNNDVVEDIALWLNGFDLLITDYSSIYLDYLMLDRPMMFLPYDKEEYLQKRGMNFTYDEVTPGPKPTTWNGFMKNIEEAMRDPSRNQDSRRACNDFFNEVRTPCCQHICLEIYRKITDVNGGAT